jgi:hypothetical protein
LAINYIMDTRQMCLSMCTKHIKEKAIKQNKIEGSFIAEKIKWTGWFGKNLQRKMWVYLLA